MNIAFDVSDLCTGRSDGTTRYTIELAKRLPFIASDTVWNFYGPCSVPMATIPPHAKWHASPFPYGWTQARLPFELFRDKPDVLFMPIQQLPIFRPHRMKTVAVIHDLAFHEHHEQFRYKDWLLLHTFSAQVANEADAIIAVSESTKKDIETYYGRTKNVHVIHHGIDHERFRIFTTAEKEEGLRKLQKEYPTLTTPYILFVGQIQPRKNIVRLVEAFTSLRSSGSIDIDMQLVIAGGHGWNNKEIYEAIERSSQRAHITVTGAVTDELLPTLYAHARVFVLPSLQEGFGIPLIEAAACGVPIVTSNRSSMEELARGAGVLVNPMNVSSIARGMQEALEHAPLYSKKSVTMASRFSWDDTAQETMRVLRDVCTNTTRKGVTHI